MTSPRSCARRLLICGLALVATHSLAQAPAERAGPRNQFELGAWAVRHSHTVRVDPLFSGNTGSDDISLENDLGLKRNGAAFTVGYTRLIGQAWHFNAEYARSSRDASHRSTRALQIGDAGYASGSTLQSDTHLIYASFAAGWSLVQREGTEFGLRMGGLTARTRLTVNDGARNLKLSWYMGEALPMVGLFVHTGAGDSWRFDARLDAAARDGARATHLKLGLGWQPTSYLGLNAGWRLLSGRSGRDDFDFFLAGRERVKYRVSGPQLSARLAF